MANEMNVMRISIHLLVSFHFLFLFRLHFQQRKRRRGDHSARGRTALSWPGCSVGGVVMGDQELPARAILGVRARRGTGCCDCVRYYVSMAHAPSTYPQAGAL